MPNAEPCPLALVVDDQAEVCATLGAILEDAGYEVVTAFSAPGALLALPAGRKLDVLLTDVYLREGDGISLSRTLRQLHPEAVIVLTSGWPQVEESTIPPGTRFLRKPFTIELLLGEVRAAREDEQPGHAA
jgi:CheY-like chemotaxis protein